MTKQTDNEQNINKFFFGKMDEDERFAFENEFAANPELLEEMRAFEDDLIEKYIRGWMNFDQQSEFETHFLNTEKRRQKVEFSRQLISEIRQEIKSNTEKESVWNRFGNLFSTPKFAFGTAFAIIILVFGGWFLSGNFEPAKPEIVKNQNIANTENANLKNDTNLVKTSIDTNQTSNENMQNMSVNKPAKSPTPQKTPKPPPTPISETPKAVPNPILALFAGTLRNGGEINELNLPQNARGATFQLNLKTVDYKIFRADIADANGQIIFKSENLIPRKSVIYLFVPAKKLIKGDYRINLFGKNLAGEYESVADFQFRVN